MDDFVLFGDDKSALHDAHGAIAAFLGDELRLELKARATRLLPTHCGLPFLGFVLFPGLVRVQPASLARYRWRLAWLRWQFERGAVDAEGYRRAVAAVFDHVATASTRALGPRWLADHTLDL